MTISTANIPLRGVVFPFSNVSSLSLPERRLNTYRTKIQTTNRNMLSRFVQASVFVFGCPDTRFRNGVRSLPTRPFLQSGDGFQQAPGTSFPVELPAPDMAFCTQFVPQFPVIDYQGYFSAMSFASSGFAYWAASPQTSLNGEMSDTTTGVPAYMASRGGMPKPSYSDGYTKHAAFL